MARRYRLGILGETVRCRRCGAFLKRRSEAILVETKAVELCSISLVYTNCTGGKKHKTRAKRNYPPRGPILHKIKDFGKSSQTSSGWRLTVMLNLFQHLKSGHLITLTRKFVRPCPVGTFSMTQLRFRQEKQSNKFRVTNKRHAELVLAS